VDNAEAGCVPLVADDARSRNGPLTSGVAAAFW